MYHCCNQYVYNMIVQHFSFIDVTVVCSVLQDIASALGAPSQHFYKAEDKVLYPHTHTHTHPHTHPTPTHTLTDENPLSLSPQATDG